MSDTYADFNVQVKGAIPGSFSAHAKIQRGDVIVSVNGNPTRTLQAYFEETEKARTFSETKTIEYLRDGQLHKATMPSKRVDDVNIENMSQDQLRELAHLLKSAGMIPEDTPVKN